MTNAEDQELLKTMKRLLQKPRTIDELVRKTLVSERTVYRYLGKLDVVRVGINRPTRYQLKGRRNG